VVSTSLKPWEGGLTRPPFQRKRSGEVGTEVSGTGKSPGGPDKLNLSVPCKITKRHWWKTHPKIPPLTSNGIKARKVLVFPLK